MTDQPSEPAVDQLDPATGPNGQLAHPDAVAHLERLTPRLYPVGEHAWCVVGNGLSNQTFVRTPTGIIAVDSGECIEEMKAALMLLRQVTEDPIIACIYTHFHYVNGTQAILDDLNLFSGQAAGGATCLKIYGHRRIEHNLARFGGEVGPRSGKGLVHQFGVALPLEGPDGLLHCGLGLHLQNPAHAPYTPGYIPAQILIDEPGSFEIGGLEVQLTPAPSDADDSLTIWIPALRLAINNLIWPALFNIYAIRGEEYRDPQVLLSGLDHLISLTPKDLIGTHGPPLTNLKNTQELLAYRDSIQFLWDQTVRRINAGEYLNDVVEQIKLPAHLAENYLTQQYYGVAEHHIKQIHAGLFGWFDGDESQLFTLPTRIRSNRLITGFGGREAVAEQATQALVEGDYRWALELAAWLVQSDDVSAEDKNLLAKILRYIGQHTISANVRNWTLTRALVLEGEINLDRFNVHRFNRAQVLAAPPARFIPTLRVLLKPEAAVDLSVEVCWKFPSGERCGLQIRNQVAVATQGSSADIQLGVSHETWADILSNKLNIWAGIEAGIVAVSGDTPQFARFCAAFDLASLRQ